MYSFIRRCSTTILSNLEIRLSVRYPGVVTKRPKRLTHYPTVNTLSNGLHTIQMLTHYPITDARRTKSRSLKGLQLEVEVGARRRPYGKGAQKMGKVWSQNKEY